MAMKYNRLGDMLVESGAITEAQLRQALELQAGSGERLGTVLQPTASSRSGSSSTR